MENMVVFLGKNQTYTEKLEFVKIKNYRFFLYVHGKVILKESSERKLNL